MTTTYEPIATTTLGSAAATITFSSIPSTYTDLRISTVLFPGTSARMQINGDTGTNYSSTFLYTINTSTPAAGNRVNDTHIPITLGAAVGTTIPVMTTIDIFSYTNTSGWKNLLWQESSDKNGDASAHWVISGFGLWRSTSAITSVNFFNPGFNFAAGSTATLYGIKAE
jgi:hypothetical protein